jgi:transcription elongation factor Elf1
MIIYCEECGAKNSVAVKKVVSAKGQIQCTTCHDYFQVPPEKLDQAIKEVATPDPVWSSASQLVLKFQDVVVNVNASNTPIRIGRSEDNHIRVVDRRASRLHATVEYVKGKFMITDSSLNGTYVKIAGREVAALKKKQLLLVNNGVIGLGHKVGDHSKDAIHFSVQVDITRTLGRVRDENDPSSGGDEV